MVGDKMTMADNRTQMKSIQWLIYVQEISSLND